MPTSIFFNGERRFRPNVYTRIINNLGAANGLATGNIAIVGDFPQLKQATPVTFSNALDFNDFFRETNQDLVKLGKLMFNPLDVDGSITSLTVVSMNDATVAKFEDNGLKVLSRLYGIDGNRIKVAISANADDAELYDIKVFDGVIEVESIEGIGEGNIASVSYTKAAGNAETFSTVNMINDDSRLSIQGLILGAGAVVNTGQNFVNAAAPCVSNISLSCTNDQTADMTFNIVGLGESGQAVGESITIPNGTLSSATFITTAVFSEISSITKTAGGNLIGNLSVSLDIFSADHVDSPNIEDRLNEIVALNGDLSGDFAITAPAAITAGGDLDAVAVRIDVTAGNLTADLKYIIEWLNGSAYVSAERLSVGSAPSLTTTRLTGGSKDSAPVASDWTTAFTSIKRSDLNIVVPFSSETAVAQQAQTHALEAAQEAGFERNVWFGTAAGSSIANTFAVAKTLNDRNIAITNQSITVEGVSLDPKFTACLFAAMQGATPIAEPLTRKRPLAIVTATSEGFQREDQADLAIRRGIVFFADPSNTGLRVERSVTTWLKDDNPVYSEVSANESLNFTVRQVRLATQSQIGTKIVSGKKGDVERVVTNALVSLKTNGIIRDFADLSVNLIGDTANVAFSVATVEPLNFITITTTVVR